MLKDVNGHKRLLIRENEKSVRQQGLTWEQVAIKSLRKSITTLMIFTNGLMSSLPPCFSMCLLIHAVSTALGPHLEKSHKTHFYNKNMLQHKSSGHLRIIRVQLHESNFKHLLCTVNILILTFCYACSKCHTTCSVYLTFS